MLLLGIQGLAPEPIETARGGRRRNGTEICGLVLFPVRAVIVRAVYLQGCTYEEAAARTGIPFGSLKRALREGLAALRLHLEASDEPP